MSPRQVGPPAPESVPFWDATRERRLVLQWCTSCGQPVQFPRAFCPHCSAPRSALEWREASGLARVHAVTVEHRPELSGAEEPFAIALVDLDEGARLMTNVVGKPAGEVQIGDRVRVTWEPLEDGRHLPLFEPAGG